MKAIFSSLAGGAIGAVAIVLIAWTAELPRFFSWVSANGQASQWVGIAVSAIGLWLIFRQLKLTAQAARSAEESANAARVATDIALAESRPWLKMEIAGNAEVVVRPDRKSLSAHIKVTVENIGRTPATHVHYHWDLLTKTDDETLQAKLINPIGPAHQGSVIFPGETTGFGGTRNLILDENDMAIVNALLIVTYNSPGGRKHQTAILAVEPTWQHDASIVGKHEVDLCSEVRSTLQPT